MSPCSSRLSASLSMDMSSSTSVSAYDEFSELTLFLGSFVDGFQCCSISSVGDGVRSTTGGLDSVSDSDCSEVSVILMNGFADNTAEGRLSSPAMPSISAKLFIKLVFILSWELA